MVMHYTKVYVGKHNYQQKICQEILRCVKKLYLHNFEKISMELSIGICKKCMLLLRKFSSKPRNQWTGSIFVIQEMCLVIIPFSSHYYIFDSHSCDNIGEASENGSSVLLKFLTIEHVLNL